MVPKPKEAPKEAPKETVKETVKETPKETPVKESPVAEVKEEKPLSALEAIEKAVESSSGDNT